MKQITSINSWHKITPDSENTEWPSARSGHACVIFRDMFLFIFGGMDENDSLRDMYEYNIPNNVIGSFPFSVALSNRNGEKFSRKIRYILQVLENYLLKFYSSKARASHAMVSIDQISKLYLSGGIDSNQTFKKLF